MNKAFSLLLCLLSQCVFLKAQEKASPKFLFTENKGQVTDQYGKVRNDIYFVSTISGMQLTIGENGLHYQWKRSADTACKKDALENEQFDAHRVDARLTNSSTPSNIITEQVSADFNNYYLAHCPRGITGVKKYGKVTLQNVYNNIDWVFYSNNGDVEYDFVVKPGGNPDDILMSYEGATELNISETGSLIITTPLGSCEQKAPKAWQGDRQLESKFILEGNALHFKVNNYNPEIALVIDPLIKIWGTYFGGTANDVATDVKVDDLGNAYMTGYTTSNNITTVGAHQATYNGNTDGFVVKYNVAGNVVWSTYYGGTGADNLSGSAIDKNGNVFISGTTNSANAIAANGYQNHINISSAAPTYNDGFLVKLNSNGVRQWGTYFGNAIIRTDISTGVTDTAEYSDEGYGCAVDASGNVFVCGLMSGNPYACSDSNGVSQMCPGIYLGTPGSYQPGPAPGYGNGPYPFIMKFSPTGARLWGTFYGNMTTDNYSPGVFCAVDKNGNAYLSSTTDNWYQGPSLAQNGHQNTRSAQEEGWLAKFNTNGDSLLWATYYGGSKEDIITGVCTDGSNNVIISGLSRSPSGISSGGGGPLNSNGTSSFFAIFNENGTRNYARFYGEFTIARSSSCAADSAGNIYATTRGFFTSSSPGLVSYCGNNSTTLGVSILKFDATGKKLWAEAYRSDEFGTSSNCAVSYSGKYACMADYYTYVAAVPLNAAQNTVAGGTDAYLITYLDTAILDTVCGHVFYDTNANGALDSGEQPMINHRVYMGIQGTSRSVYTDASGYYQFVYEKWGTSGDCFGNLAADLPGGNAFSVPINNSYSLTQINAGSGCNYDFAITPAVKVSGIVYYDNNRNATYQTTEAGISSQSVSFNAQRSAYTYTDGTYETYLPIGSYTETFDKRDAYGTSVSNPSSYSIVGNTGGAVFPNYNFGAYFSPTLIDSRIKMWVTGIPPVVGQVCSFTARVYNTGSFTTADTLVFYYDSLLIPLDTNLSFVINPLTHTITYITGAIVPARYQNITFTFLVPSTVAAGQILHNWAFVNPTSQPDINMADNTTHNYITVLSSYDPNNKLSETNTSNPQIHNGANWSNGDDDIQYIINYQNTGTYAAVNITIIDTLPTSVDAASFRFLHSSNGCRITRNGQVITFKYTGIYLPDSAHNPEGSKGFIVFEVKPIRSLQQGDSIVNRAAIYFDYNTPVITKKNIINISGSGPCTTVFAGHIYDTVCNFITPYIYQGQSITRVGNYTSDTITTPEGCDSVTILHLVYPTMLGKLTASSCSAPYSFNGKFITAPGIYYDTLHPASGCDSIVELTLGRIINTSIAKGICPGDSFYFNNGYIKTAGAYRDTLQTAYGCDSIVTAQVSILAPKATSLTATFCTIGSYEFNGRIVNTPGVYKDTLTGINGCDSIVTLNLLARPMPAPLIRKICEGEGLIFNNTFIDAPGTYCDTLVTSNGCDSVITLQLSLWPVKHTFLNASICTGDSIYFNAHFIGTSGVYFDTLATVTGCDSILELNLSFWHANSTFISDSICNGNAYNFNGKLITSPGLYYDTLTSDKGCDSIITLSLAFLAQSASVIQQTICAGDSFYFNGRFLETGGTFSDTLVAANGCDSIVKLHLSLWPVSTTTINDSICYNSTYLFNGTVIEAAGVYIDTLSNVYGCDSTVTLNLSILPAPATEINLTICAGDSIYFGGQILKTPGTFFDTLNSVNGCDSIITLNLMVSPHFSSVLNQTICTGDSFYFNERFLSAGGIYLDTLTSSAICDSLITLNLTIQPIIITTISAEICLGSSYYFNEENIAVPGIYRDTVSSSTGCDSVITLNLTLMSPDTGIVVNGMVCTANQAGAVYQWYDCNTNTPVSGATSQSFTATQIGVYRCSIVMDTCAISTNCVTTYNVGVNVIDQFNLSIYPNPNSGCFIVQHNYKGNVQGTIENMLGQTVKTICLSGEQTQINLNEFPNGIYSLIISNNGKRLATGKIIKQ